MIFKKIFIYLSILAAAHRIFHCGTWAQYPYTCSATWCKVWTHWKRPWCWERLKAGGEGDNRGWDGWMASLTQWTWIWANSGRWWRTGKPGVLQSMGSQRVRHNLVAEQQGMRDLVPRPGIEHLSPALQGRFFFFFFFWQGRFLTTVPPGKSLLCFNSISFMPFSIPASSDSVSLLFFPFSIPWIFFFTYVLRCSVLSDSLWPQGLHAAHQAPLSVGILQARILEWVAMPSSRGSSQPRYQTQASHIAGRLFYQLSYHGSPRILEWVAYPFSRGSSWLRNQTRVSCTAGGIFTSWVTRKAFSFFFFFFSALFLCHVLLCLISEGYFHVFALWNVCTGAGLCL